MGAEHKYTTAWGDLGRKTLFSGSPFFAPCFAMGRPSYAFLVHPKDRTHRAAGAG